MKFIIANSVVILCFLILVSSLNINVDLILSKKEQIIEKDDEMDLMMIQLIRDESLGFYENMSEKVKNMDKSFSQDQNEEHLQEAMSINEINQLFGNDEDFSDSEFDDSDEFGDFMFRQEL
jgi:hypothetical protein